EGALALHVARRGADGVRAGEGGLGPPSLVASGGRIVDERTPGDGVPRDVLLRAARGGEIALGEKAPAIRPDQQRAVRPVADEGGVEPSPLAPDGGHPPRGAPGPPCPPGGRGGDRPRSAARRAGGPPTRSSRGRSGRDSGCTPRTTCSRRAPSPASGSPERPFRPRRGTS